MNADMTNEREVPMLWRPKIHQVEDLFSFLAIAGTRSCCGSCLSV